MNGHWKTALIVGASSGIGESLAQQLAKKGCKVALVARREPELHRLADILNTNSTSNALIYVHDVRNQEIVPALFNQITHELGGMDLLIYAAGVMPAVSEVEFSTEKDSAIIETNLIGAMAWLNEAARRCQNFKGGTIVGISSVAGDRGRRGSPAYGASKAGLNVYLESLYNRLSRYGVKVVNIKPGPVSTPMTAGMAKLPMVITADEAATSILAAAARGAKVAYVPGKWRLIMWIIRCVPSFLFKRLGI